MRALCARRRPAVILAASAALGLLCPAARAEDAVALPDAPAPADAAAVVVEDTAPAAVRYTGRNVSQLSLVAPEGGLPAESLEPLLRVQQDVGAKSKAALVYTDRIDGDRSNRVIGSDARFIWKDIYSLTLQGAISRTATPAAVTSAPLWCRRPPT